MYTPTGSREFVTLALCGAPWTFRALDLDQMEQLEPQFAEAAALSGASVTSMPKAGLQAIAVIACESLRHEHADITVSQCRKLITLGTINQVIEAVRGVSSLEQADGEAPAAKPATDAAAEIAPTDPRRTL